MTKIEYQQLQTERQTFCLTKPIFELEREFNESNPYMKFGRNCVIND